MTEEDKIKNNIIEFFERKVCNYRRFISFRNNNFFVRCHEKRGISMMINFISVLDREGEYITDALAKDSYTHITLEIKITHEEI